MSRRGEIDGDDGTGLSSSVRLLGTDVLVRGCGMIPGGVDSGTAGLLLEGGLRGALGNGNNSEVWAPVAASQLKFHPPVVWKPARGWRGRRGDDAGRERIQKRSNRKESTRHRTGRGRAGETALPPRGIGGREFLPRQVRIARFPNPGTYICPYKTLTTFRSQSQRKRRPPAPRRPQRTFTVGACFFNHGSDGTPRA